VPQQLLGIGEVEVINHVDQEQRDFRIVGCIAVKVAIFLCWHRESPSWVKTGVVNGLIDKAKRVPLPRRRGSDVRSEQCVAIAAL
jgi:hypothetical protein